MTPIKYFQNGLGRYLWAFFVLSDLVLSNLLFGVALWLCPAVDPGDVRLMWVLVNVSYMPVLIRGIGERFKDRTILLDRVVADTLLGVVVHALFFLSLTEILSDTSVPAVVYAVYYTMMAVLMPIVNMSTRRFVKNCRRRGYNFVRVVIVGTNPTAERLFDELEFDAGYGYRTIGFFDDSCREGFRYAGLYVGTVDMLDAFVKANKVDQIYYALNDSGDGKLPSVVKVADDNGAEFFYAPQLKPSLGRRMMVLNIGPVTVLAGRRNPLKNPFNRAVKRGADLLISSLFLITLYPVVYVVVAIAIKMTSPGPVYFRQKRTGYRGESFDCLKFRTMHVNNEADTCQTTKDDPRKTRLGDFLRRTSLDELPQFVNVWRGDMSIVGPRPHMLKHTEIYSKLIDRYMVRHIVKPGITGWAQVNGYRGLTDELWKMEKRVEYDVWYIENWTFFLDLKIMVRTVLNAIHGEKNAF